MFGDRMSSREFNSPESTVSCLLASSGHLRSSLDPEQSLTFRYRDKRFESASAALDAYIEDFERKRSPTRSHLLTGQYAKVRNRDVLQDQLTDAELDFLTLPVGVHQPDVDRLSVTTDDLLVLPCNGSLPITRTSAFLSQSGAQSRSLCLGQHAHSHPSNRHRPRRDCADIACAQHSACYNLLQPRQQAKRPQTLATSTGLGLKSSQKTYQDLNRTSAPASPRRYPRWMTSQKAEMDMSGISSIPDMKYPGWIQDCGLPLDAPARQPSYEKATTSRCSPKVPYWLGELEASYERLPMGSVGHSGASSNSGDLLGDLPASRFKEEAGFRSPRQLFGEQLFQTSERDCRDMDDLFLDDGLERLILKAETALSSSSLGRSSPSLGLSSPSLGLSSPSLGLRSPSLGRSSPSLGRSSPSLGLSSPSLGVICPRQADMDQADSSEDSLEADRSWDNPAVTFKSPVPVGGAASPVMADMPFNERNESKGSCSSGYSSRKAPGPVEALKQMLFSLQAVEQQIFQPSEDQGPDAAASDPRHAGDGRTERNLDGNAETAGMSGTGMEAYDAAPGGQSLQRALHHLGRLKSLVEDHQEKIPEGNTS